MSNRSTAKSDPKPKSRRATARPETPSWWRQPRSLAEIAELISQVIDEKSEAERQLVRTRKSQKELESRLRKAEEALERERGRFTSELYRLQSKARGTDDGPRDSESGHGRPQAEPGAQRRLMEEEIERRIHALRLEWKHERHDMRQQIVDLQQEIETYRLTTGDF